MTSTDLPTVRLIGFNLEHDGGRPEPGNPDFTERWALAHRELLAPREPDAVFRQEMTFSADEGEERLHRAENILDMQGYLSPTGQGRNPTGLFLRQRTFASAKRYQQLKVWRTPPTNVVARLPEAPEVPIVMGSAHGSFCSPLGREQEAEDASAWVDKVKQGAACILEGDWNEYPVPVGEVVPEIDWDDPAITDKVHRRHRAKKQPDGTWKSCTFTDELMLDCEMHDPARYVAREFEKAAALAATAGHAAQGQGGGRRIDRFYLDRWMVTAVEDVNILDTSGISDHHAVEVILSRKGMIAALRRTVRPEPAFFSLAV